MKILLAILSVIAFVAFLYFFVKYNKSDYDYQRALNIEGAVVSGIAMMLLNTLIHLF